ncbi:molybdate ABC transporter substrate-binding protein [Pontibacillus sp. HMF3514]|uniref:molybdate ABC transporter substrate-binding protein n=1 Tax=Pontibacillus sp. HMF3514 TaxID=2692425 RepID=UPI0013201440|nr:molybdate ABC transporter substrate-binding protein [Pontibacillus sp. HMF3514]QHE51301.1 molybdate ABC transporter substrate-binding protein [Pontibacillus sp. HMF3514]
MKRFILFILFVILLTSCNQRDPSSQQASLRISAASSLTTVMKEIKKQYEKKHPDQEITIQYASSGTLAHQLIQGAPSDIYISASEYWMDKVVQEGLIQQEDVFPLLKNRLILATHQGKEIKISQLTNESIDQFAMGDPESVPAGAYAKQALEHAKVWETVKDKAVYGKNVRQVASYIQSQNVKAGFVYQSDVQALTNVQKSQVIPEEYHETITYPMGIINESKKDSSIKGFIKYLKGSEAKKVFQSYGFVPIE